MLNDTPVIGIIDDDPFIVDILCELFKETEFETVIINESEDIEAAIDNNNVKLILLDLNLKNHYGFEIARLLRSRENLGLIMLTGSKDQVDKLVGLEIGLDDYILKPFDKRELTARCRNVLRRVSLLSAESSKSKSNKASGENNSYLGPLRLDLSHFKLLHAEGGSVKLTPHEFRLVELLIKAGGEAVTREQISTEIFEREWTPYTRSVDMLVSKLRKKINELSLDVAINTVRGKGYILSVSAA